ncbi:DUF1304 domain-containing protein [Nocardia sp. N2S4-5]|uniref:DUF1304 domain-containing protein n=1 Tax=Nocardia sp. N2S4-5 TaxID=3351565 RepID=UPI0037D10ED8
MLAAVQIFAVLSALVHGFIFVLECFRFTDPNVHRKIFRVSEADLAGVRNWAFNQGFYNLFLGIGALVGAVLVRTHAASGWSLILLSCGSMLGAAVVLIASDRTFIRPAFIQGIFPTLTLLAALTQI